VNRDTLQPSERIVIPTEVEGPAASPPAFGTLDEFSRRLEEAVMGKAHQSSGAPSFALFAKGGISRICGAKASGAEACYPMEFIQS